MNVTVKFGRFSAVATSNGTRAKLDRCFFSSGLDRRTSYMPTSSAATSEIKPDCCIARPVPLRLGESRGESVGTIFDSVEKLEAESLSLSLSLSLFSLSI